MADARKTRISANLPAHALGLLIVAISWCAPACAQQAATGAAANNTHFDLNLPVFGSSNNNAYDLSGTTTTLNTAPAPTPPAQAALPDNYTFSNFAQSIHGYVEAGVGTQNGHNFSGGVEMPLVPGKVDLAVGASTGQQGGFVPYAPGTKPGSIHYDTYYASVHLHPADNFDAYIGITGGHVGLSNVLVP
jgi:hypothetical protein